jgi:hypothetical protein
MSDPRPFLMVEQSCNEAIAWVVQRAGEVGLQVVRTFDLQDARRDPVVCPCPTHGSDPCDCQMVVLLVYGDDIQPTSLVVHSRNGKTWFSMVDLPQQPADSHLEAALQQALSDDNAARISQPDLCRAARFIHG